MKKLLDFLNRVIRRKKIDQIMMEQCTKGAICPYMRTSCIGSKCLSFKVFEEEWEEAILAENQSTKRMEEKFTGKVLRGAIADCRIGIFSRKILNSEIIKDAEKPSPLIKIS